MSEKLHAHQPLLDPFTAKCLNAFKDKPEQSNFEALVLSDLIIGKVTRKNGLHTADINSVERGFSAPKQTWTPAGVHTTKSWALTDTEEHADKATVVALTAPGVYNYTDGDGVKIIVLLDPETGNAAAQLAAAQVVIKEAFNYDLPAEQFVAGKAGAVLISGDCVLGEVEYALASKAIVEVPSEPAMQL